MGKKVGYAIIIAFVLLVVAVAIYGLGWYIPTPNPIPPSPPGPEPEIVYKTDVKISYYWFQPAKIEEVKTTMLSTQAAVTTGQPKITLFPFNGILRLEVVYPNSARVAIGEQKVSVEKGVDITVTFMWKTKFSGKHIVIASLYDEAGNLVDQKSEEVFAPER